MAEYLQHVKDLKKKTIEDDEEKEDEIGESTYDEAINRILKLKKIIKDNEELEYKFKFKWNEE